MTFHDDLAAAKTADTIYTDTDVLINKTLYTLRFYQMPGDEWAAETDRHPARPGVLVDMRYGYNLRSLTRGAAPRSGFLRVDGANVALRVDTDEVPGQEMVDEWKDLLDSLSGHDFQRVTDAIWNLNEYLPQQEVDAARKALAASGNTSS